MRINCGARDCVYFHAGLCSRPDSITVNAVRECTDYERKKKTKYDRERGTSSGYTPRYR